MLASHETTTTLPDTALAKERTAAELRALILIRICDAYDFFQGSTGLTVAQIGRWISVGHSTVNYHCKSLLEDGLIDRIEGTQDLIPTRQGRASVALFRASGAKV